jgi:hypothetical protein
MALATAYRVPHSVFLGWDADDRDKAVAWHLRRLETCLDCGTRAEEWDPERGGAKNAYRAELVRCAGCEARERAEASVPKDAGRGVTVVLKPNPKASRG